MIIVMNKQWHHKEAPLRDTYQCIYILFCIYIYIGDIWAVLCYEFDILLALVMAELWPGILTIQITCGSFDFNWGSW